MKILFTATLVLLLSTVAVDVSAQATKTKTSDQSKASKQLYMDVHELEPGKVTYEAVADAHKKDLVAQNKYGVSFMKYWVDESKGLVYCLASATDTSSIIRTHAEAHGLLPSHIYAV